jgi:hypothetical protein
MDSKTFKIRSVQFSEHPVFDFAQSEPDKFDISAIGLNFPSSFIQDGNFLMDAYCEAILRKVTILCKAELLDFIEYQYSKLKKPMDWLDNLETLIDINSVYFEGENKQSIFNKLDMNIQVCRASLKHIRKPLKSQLINWNEIFQPDKFDFDMVKFDLQKLNSNTEKKAYLIEAKADFLQSENICSISSNKAFANNIDIELAKIEDIEKLPSTENTDCSSRSTRSIFGNPALTGKSTRSTNSAVDLVDQISDLKKIRINWKINILVDIFYRLLYEFKPDGKPYLDATPSEVAHFICNNFVDRNGKNLSISTIKTMLTPNKADKRPSCDKRFCLRNLINPSFILFHMYIIDYLNIIDFSPMLN